MNVKSLSLLLISLPYVAIGQVNYVVQKTSVLVAAGEVITIQQPSIGARAVIFKAATIDCPSTCTITLERNGTAAQGTALSPLNVNPGETPPATKAFHSSDVGIGSILSVLTLPGAGLLTIDLSTITFQQANNPGQNLSIRVSSVTGTAHVTIQYTER